MSETRKNNMQMIEIHCLNIMQIIYKTQVYVCVCECTYNNMYNNMYSKMLGKHDMHNNNMKHNMKICMICNEHAK